MIASKSTIKGETTLNSASEPNICFNCPKVIPNLAVPIPFADIVKALAVGEDFCFKLLGLKGGDCCISSGVAEEVGED